MKATKLILKLKEAIEKHGENLEVFLEVPQFNAEETDSIDDNVGSSDIFVKSLLDDNVRSSKIFVKSLLNYPHKELLSEDTGLIYGFILGGDRLLYTDG